MNLSHKSHYVIYLAGGCFWGLEHLMHSIPGVLDTQCGYANGTCAADANYKTVCAGKTGFRETVQVRYDPQAISLDALLLTFFSVIDSSVKNRQGNDVGTQYQTGVYYSDDETRGTVERIAALERSRRTPFQVEIGPLRNFYPAEEVHQSYLKKNPGGYCHISPQVIARFSHLRIDPGAYQKPADEILRKSLTPEQYAVTQEQATEPPFTNSFWNQFQRGIYVDVVTGEPLFSSSDQFASSCGWPAFSRPLEAPVLVELEDFSHGMHRTEVRSRAGNSHLGHVFFGEPGTPSGVRYCINSAALRFVPYEEMDAQGYGALKDLL